MVDRKQIQHVMASGKDRLLLYDISSPRNLDPSIRKVKNVSLHDMETLNLHNVSDEKNNQAILKKASVFIKEQGFALFNEIILHGSNSMELEKADI